MPDDQPWKAPSPNKHRKKKSLSGELNRVGRRRKRDLPKRRTAGETILSLCDCFVDLTDPRVERSRRHLLIDIVVIAVLAVLANSDKWKDIHIWAESNCSWLSSILELPNGIPSRDTFRRTISRLDPQEFQNAFLDWLRGMRKGLRGVVAVDGKTVRGSKAGGNKPLHIVSAWATEQNLTLGQRLVDGKSNEITAIPILLRTLAIKGAIVTIDAMGCQKEIAATIVAAKAHYCLAVKGNQETLAKELERYFEQAVNDDFQGIGQQQLETIDPKRPHGRDESRYYYTMPVPKMLEGKANWKNLTSIGMTVTYRSKGAEGEVRYYIMSFKNDVEAFARAVRSHWAIENSLHWVMDVTFREDECRIRKDHGGENVSWLRRLAITILKNDTTRKDSIRAKRIRAGYDLSFLKDVINAIPLGN